MTIVGLLILILDIVVISRVLRTSEDAAVKLLWVILVIILPLLGPILFFLIGPGKRSV